MPPYQIADCDSTEVHAIAMIRSGQSGWHSSQPKRPHGIAEKELHVRAGN